MSVEWEKLAENIVNYRSENGPFENKQLKSTSIGKKAYQQGSLLSEFQMQKTHWIIRRYIRSIRYCRKNGKI
jgi:hypothetical protein